MNAFRVISLTLIAVITLTVSGAQAPKSPSIGEQVRALVARYASSRGTDARWDTVQAIVVLGPDAIPTLEQALLSSDSLEREGAARALGVFGTQAEAAVPALIQAIERDKHWIPRGFSIRALGWVGVDSRDALDVLTGLLSSETPTDRRAAAEALRRLGPKAAPAVPGLIQLIEAGDSLDRVSGLVTLIEIGSLAHEAIPTATKCLRNTEPNELSYALHFLAIQGSEARQAVPTICELMTTRPRIEDPVLGEAVLALAAIGDKSAVVQSALESVERSAGPIDAMRAGVVLRSMFADNSEAKLIEGLNSDNVGVQSETLRMILELPSASPKLVEAVSRLLPDRDTRNLRITLTAIESIARLDPAGPHSAEAAKSIVRFLSQFHVDDETFKRFARAAGRLRTQGDILIPTLRSYVASPSPVVRQIAQEAIDSIEGP